MPLPGVSGWEEDGTVPALTLCPTQPAHLESRPLLCPVTLLHPPSLSSPHPKGPMTHTPRNALSSGVHPCGQPRSHPWPHTGVSDMGGCVCRPGQASRGPCHGTGLRTAGLARGLPCRRCRMPGSGPEHRFQRGPSPPGGSDAALPGLRGPGHPVVNRSPSPLPPSL